MLFMWNFRLKAVFNWKTIIKYPHFTSYTSILHLSYPFCILNLHFTFFISILYTFIFHYALSFAILCHLLHILSLLYIPSFYLNFTSFTFILLPLPQFYFLYLNFLSYTLSSIFHILSLHFTYFAYNFYFFASIFHT